MYGNWTQGHRYSFPQYQQNLEYSPLQGGNDGRTASLGHAQYPSFPSPSPYHQGSGQQGTSYEFQNSYSKAWQHESSPSQQFTQPQRVSANSVDLNDIQHFVRPVHEESWTGAGGRVTHDARPQQGLQPWHSTFQGPRAHTITDGGFSPVFRRPQPFTPTRTSVPSLIDSGIVSSSTSSQDVSKHPHSNYDYPTGESSLFNPPLPATPRSAKSEPRTPEETKRRRKYKPPLSPCPHCNKELKNPSDARKHTLQHEKPYACEVPSCGRRQGFATQNDLQRHRKSVHGARPSVGKQTGYICQACTSANPGAVPKWWPRLDNFKAHIERKHKDRDRDQLVAISIAPRPDRAITESGYGSQPAASVLTEDQAYQQDMLSPLEVAMSRQCSNQDDMALFGATNAQFDTLAGVGEGPFSDPFGGTRAMESRQYGSGNMTNGLSVLHDAALQQLTSPVDSILTSPGVYHARVPSIRVDEVGFTDSIPAFNQPQRERYPQKRIKTEWPSEAGKVSNSQDNLNANRTESGEFACPHCPKTKKRECDLRKHIKRHTRPYGCTFPNCYKRFGSRNDWKRHENSQHFLQEMWRCGLKTTNGDTCGRLISQESFFVTHLQKRHGLDPASAETQDDTKSMHLGREGHKNFWCGFCDSLIAQPDSSQQDSIQQSAWVLRFKHIGDHFDKRDGHIDDWVCIEHNKKKGLITREDRKKSKARFRDGKAADDSDLPDDGIPSKYIPGHSGSQSSSNFDVKISPDMSMPAPNKRKYEDDGDDDADGVSD